MSADPFWSRRRVLVTGATGMIGSWLVKELLARSAHVVALLLDVDPQSELLRSGDIHRVSVVNGDLGDFRTLERAINLHETDTVIHLGAQTIVGAAHRFPLATFESNIRGTYNLLDACRLHQGLIDRIVLASSDKAYGEQAALPYTEDMPLAGRHPYEVSKSCTDLLGLSYHRTYDLPVAITRFGNVYGGGDLNWSRLVPGTIRSFIRGERPIIRSDGAFLRDYVYVKDAVRAYMTLAEHLDDARVRGRAFNFSAESPIPVLDVVAAIQALMQCEHLPPDIQNSATGEIRDQYLSAKAARDVLGWTAGCSLTSGLQETIAWYRRLDSLSAHGVSPALRKGDGA